MRESTRNERSSCNPLQHPLPSRTNSWGLRNHLELLFGYHKELQRRRKIIPLHWFWGTSTNTMLDLGLVFLFISLNIGKDNTITSKLLIPSPWVERTFSLQKSQMYRWHLSCSVKSKGNKLPIANEPVHLGFLTKFLTGKELSESNPSSIHRRALSQIHCLKLNLIQHNL